MTFCIPQGDVGARAGAGLVKTIPRDKKGHNEQKGRFKIPKKEKSPPVKGGVVWLVCFFHAPVRRDREI